MTEKKHLPLGSDFVTKCNYLFVREVLNPCVCVSGKLAMFLYFTGEDLNLSVSRYLPAMEGEICTDHLQPKVYS